ncbi:MAG: RnfABCDGE type electron transport complex subunit G [Clostridiales bacterium]|nr:RnfABCDGE type electron transport complex subunit G [Clostridiales bacterium]
MPENEKAKKSKSSSSIVKNTLVILIVTFVAVLLLAVVNQITLEPIEQAEVNARAEAYASVYTDAVNFSEVEDSKTLLENSVTLIENSNYAGCTIDDVLAAEDSSGNIIGYVVAATSPSGYGGEVQIAVGITTDGVITGFDVVSNSETAGLGAKCTEAEFTDQFDGKTAQTLEYSKTGATDDNEIDAISGATITTNAVTEAVNSAILFYRDSFAGGVVEEEETDPMKQAFPEVDTDSLTAVDVVETDSEDYIIDEVSQAGDLGYIITVTAHNGYDGDLQIAIGIGNDETFKGFSVLVCNETKPLGGQCTSEEFAEQFTDMKLGEVTSVASGANKDNNEIDAISGATITTSAVLTAINGAVEYYTENLSGKGE